MGTMLADENHCSSQSSDRTPDSSNGVEELSQIARELDAVITQGEQILTPSYWKLGQVLELARRHFNYRQWGKYLAQLHIDPTRASKARAIFRTFDCAEEVAALSVKEAYQRRARQKRRAARTAPPANTAGSAAKVMSSDTGAPVNLVQFFVEICRAADLCRVAADSATAEDAALYLTALDEATNELAQLRQLLTEKVASQ